MDNDVQFNAVGIFYDQCWKNYFMWLVIIVQAVGGRNILIGFAY
jgi:hypothetical protein